MQKVVYLLLTALAFCVEINAASTSSDSISIQPDLDSILVCPDGEVTLSVIGGSDYNWAPAQDFDDPNGDTVVLTPSASQWYYVTGTRNDSVYTDSIYVSFAEFSVLVSTTDTICPLDEVTVTFQSNGTISEVSWNTEDGVEDIESTSGTVITPLETTEYIVTALIDDCTFTDTFTINVVPFRFQLISEDTIFLCLGDSGTIRHSLMPLGANVVWSPLDTTITLQSPVIASVKPTISATYSATATFENCVLTTTTFVRVDSLPDTALVVVPLMDPYCAGEMITIFAERADTMKYPDIVFDWYPKDGQIQDSTNTGNVFVVLQDTTTFYRVMTNNACLDTSSVTVNVIPPDIPLSVTDTTLCPGDQFQVEILDPDVTDVEWTPEQGLSCTKCLDPTVTVQQTPITYMVMAMKDRCTVGGMLDVSIYPPLPIIITPAVEQACPGDQIAFSFDPTGLTNIEVNVTGNASVSCDDCPNPVVTYGGGQVQIFVNADETSDMHCGAGGSAVITMKPDEEQPLPSIVVCPGVPTTIPLTQFAFVNPQIEINNGTVSCTNCLNPVVTVSQTTTLIITSESQNPNACFLESSMILLVPTAGDEVDFVLGADPPFGQGEVVAVTLTTDPMPSPGTTYYWMVNAMPVTGTTSTINAPLNEVSNTIHVEWTNSFGCIQSADTVITTDPPNYSIPKAFTPDRETNTHFRVNIVGNIEILEMLVFNRWGKVVYEGVSQDGWDGRTDGERAPPEVYVYLIRLRDPSGKEILEKGDVTLIR